MQTGAGVGRPRRTGDETHSRATRQLAVSFGHHCRRPLLAAYHGTDGGVLEKSVQGGEIALARHAEDGVAALDGELVDEDAPSVTTLDHEAGLPRRTAPGTVRQLRTASRRVVVIRGCHVLAAASRESRRSGIRVRMRRDRVSLRANPCSFGLHRYNCRRWIPAEQGNDGVRSGSHLPSFPWCVAIHSLNRSRMVGPGLAGGAGCRDAPRRNEEARRPDRPAHWKIRSE